jgi:hypothetical protein
MKTHPATESHMASQSTRQNVSLKNGSMRTVAQLTFDGVNKAIGQVGVVVLHREFTFRLAKRACSGLGLDLSVDQSPSPPIGLQARLLA